MRKVLVLITIASVFFSDTECASLSRAAQQNKPAMIDQITVMADWLGMVHSLLVQQPNVATPQARAFGTEVQLAKQGRDTAWGRKSADSETSWTKIDVTPSYATINTTSAGVLVTAFGGHITRPKAAFQARFLINHSTVFDDSWGAFYIDAGSVGEWRPFCFVQMYDIPRNRPLAEIHMQTKSSSVYINGGGVMAAVFPPPAFASSLRASSATGTSNQSPYSNLVHTVDIRSDRALLIMAANGRIKGKGSGNTTLTYTVDGESPTDCQGKNYGSYFATSSSTGSDFIPMGLYQIAEVSKGTHTVQLEGFGSSFDLNYVTSQITTIPVTAIQYKRVSAEWEIETKGVFTKSLLTANVVANTDSLLVITSTFRAYGSCERVGYYQFNVDDRRLYGTSYHSTSLQFGAWYERPGSSLFRREPTPGSLLAFDRVKKGNHRVELVNYSEGSCGYKTKGAVLQVAVVPDTY